jgi:hypothetical protein
MIAVFSQDEVTNASAGVNEDLGQQVQTTTPDIFGSVFQGIRTELHAFAFQVGQNFEQAVRMTVEGAMKAGKMLLRMKTDLNRKEYRIFLSQPGWTPSKANKYIRLAKTFQGFELSQLVKVEVSTLFTLCANTYSGVVDQLRDVQQVTQDLVERLMKESRQLRKPKQQSKPITNWKQDPSGGGRHYRITVFEETGVAIEKQVQAERLTPQRVIAEAVALRAQHKNQVGSDEYTMEQMQEFQEKLEEMRELQIEKEKLEIRLQELEAQKQAEIAKLEHKVQELEQKLTARSNQVSPDTEDVAPNQSTPIKSTSEDLHQAKWQDVALPVQSQGDHLLKIVKNWTPEERQHLVNLLVTHLKSNPKALDEAKWIPEKLHEAHPTFLEVGVSMLTWDYLQPKDHTDKPSL